MTEFASTPEPPYWVAIFTSLRNGSDGAGYTATTRRMLEILAGFDGFLGAESARGTDGLGITVSYWRDGESIARWKRDLEHRQAQALGRTRWYRDYRIRVAKVERAYQKP